MVEAPKPAPEAPKVVEAPKAEAPKPAAKPAPAPAPAPAAAPSSAPSSARVLPPDTAIDQAFLDSLKGSKKGKKL